MNFRRLMDSRRSSITSIGEGSSFTGEITGKGDFVIFGCVDGDCAVEGSLTVAIGGHWKGTINASNILIAGKIDGDVNATGKLEIAASAAVTGRLTATSIALAEGAIINGSIKVTGSKDVKSFKEKRQKIQVDNSPDSGSRGNTTS